MIDFKKLSNVNINRILKLPSRLEILSRKKRKSTRNLRDLYMIDREGEIGRPLRRMPAAETQWDRERSREKVRRRFGRKDGSVISHCPIIGVSPWRDLETTRGWKGASTSPRVLFAPLRSSLPILDPSLISLSFSFFSSSSSSSFCRPQTQWRAFEKLISLPRLTRFPVRGQFLRGVVILCWNNEQGWIDISLQRWNSMLKLEQLVVTSVRQCEILVSCLMKIFEKKESPFLEEEKGGERWFGYYIESLLLRLLLFKTCFKRIKIPLQFI